MRRDFKSSIVLLIRSALTGWVAMMSVFAIDTFLLPHSPHFAPEVGRTGSFIIFGIVPSGTYLADFVLLTIPTYLLLRGRPPSLRPRHWALCGGVLFLLSLIVWWAVYGADSIAELLLWAVLAGLAGASSFYVLAPKSAPPDRSSLDHRMVV
jgi:hypothetical protein